MSMQEWAAKLSHPGVEVPVLGAEVIVQQDGERIAAGLLLPASPAGPARAGG